MPNCRLVKYLNKVIIASYVPGITEFTSWPNTMIPTPVRAGSKFLVTLPSFHQENVLDFFEIQKPKLVIKLSMLFCSRKPF